MGSLIVFAKAPVPGQVKSRLAKGMGAHRACRWYRKLLVDTLLKAEDFCRQHGHELVLYVSPDKSHPAIRSILRSFDVPVRSQCRGDLGQRMFVAMKNERVKSGGDVLLIGTDCPSLNVDVFADAFRALQEGSDAVLVPSSDGGYVLIGSKTDRSRWFNGVRWSTSRVCRQTSNRITHSGGRLNLLPSLSDIDDIQDFKHWRATNED